MVLPKFLQSTPHTNCKLQSSKWLSDRNKSFYFPETPRHADHYDTRSAVQPLLVLVVADAEQDALTCRTTHFLWACKDTLQQSSNTNAFTESEWGKARHIWHVIAKTLDLELVIRSKNDQVTSQILADAKPVCYASQHFWIKTSLQTKTELLHCRTCSHWLL